LSAKRQVTLPIRLVTQLGLEPGDELRAEAVGGRIVLTRAASLAEQRLAGIDEAAGSLAGVYEPGYLDRLRDEWR
jgi:bifunctional DNA-binding transcriptional regulator/antitoxin component of YhaV-PrlF toxin-antitoxin module